MQEIEARVKSVESTNRLLLKATKRRDDVYEAARELQRVLRETGYEYYYPPVVRDAENALLTALTRYDRALDKLPEPEAGDDRT